LKHFFIYLLVISFGFSCSQPKKQNEIISVLKNETIEKLVEYPSLESPESYKSDSFSEKFFRFNNYSYFVTIEEDSTKYFHTAETFILADKTKYFLRECEVKKQNDTLQFNFKALPNDLSGPHIDSIPYALKLFKQTDNFTSKLIYTHALLDTNWKQPIFTIITQNILLEKEKYQKGDSIKAKISLLLKAHHTAFEVNYTDTIKIYGLIKAVVK